MTVTRRQVLRAGIGAAALLRLPSGCADVGSVQSSAAGRLLTTGARLPQPFTVPLTLPTVLVPSRSDAASDYYEIRQRVAHAELLPGLETEIWGYNGSFPGPTIVSRRGRRTVVRHRNELPVPTVVHLHGGRTAPEHDGYPTDLVLPVGHRATSSHDSHGTSSAGSREYVYPLDQPAATLWYHDHRMDFTGPQVYRGLAGFHILHDDVEDALPLPRGDRDLPLMICDRAFAEDGALRYPSIDPTLTGTPGVTEAYMTGVLGDVVLVNGAPWPRTEVSNVRYRLRLLNASNARRYRLTLGPKPQSGPAFVQIGSDDGLLVRPVPQDRIDIAQAERYDVIVDFGRYPVGTQVTLVNEFGAGPAAKVMRFDVVRRATDDTRIPDHLADVEPLSRTAVSVERHFVFDQRRGGWAINGRAFDPDRMDAEPQFGSVEAWHFDSDAHHPVHLHLAHFQILSRNGRGPGRLDGGWKDTVDIQTGQETVVLARFDGYQGRYVFHCHNLEHEDMAMMGNFKVV